MPDIKIPSAKQLSIMHNQNVLMTVSGFVFNPRKERGDLPDLEQIHFVSRDGNDPTRIYLHMIPVEALVKLTHEYDLNRDQRQYFMDRPGIAEHYREGMVATIKGQLIVLETELRDRRLIGLREPHIPENYRFYLRDIINVELSQAA